MEPGRQSVVDEDDRAIANQGRRLPRPVQRVTPFKFEPLPNRDLFHERARNPQFCNQVLAQHFDAARGNGAHRKLGMTGHAKFPHEEHIERRIEPARDPVSHRNAAPRQSEHHDIGAARVVRQ